MGSKVGHLVHHHCQNISQQGFCEETHIKINMNIILAKSILRILLCVLMYYSVDGTIVAGRNHDYWIERNVRTCFCALDSNDAWNGFQGGTLDSPSLSKNISHQVKLTYKKKYILRFAHWQFGYLYSINQSVRLSKSIIVCF